ncbi:MAG TPA: YciI family protein [Steroidobacteraceae bacterium]|nr:YciI family protein [Steroidobacteraceae bacterium]
MQYMLMIYEDESQFGAAKNNPELQALVARHMEFSKNLGATRVGGAGLKSSTSATTVRRSGGEQTIHDGPFVEAREQLGGFYIVDVPNLDAAIEIAKKLPLMSSGSIEIRPLLGP